jgi:hypothetical protein
MSEAERVYAVFDDAVAIAANKWLFFSKTLAFKDEVTLEERIQLFAMPMFEGLRTHFSPLAKAPAGVLLLICAKGVEKSGTHSRAEIEQALKVQLPD